MARGMRRVALAALLVLACGTGGRVLANMVLGVAGPPAGQSIAGVTYSPPVGTFAPGAPNGSLIGAMGVTMSPAAPSFSGTLSLSGTDLARFRLTSPTMPSNLVLNGTQPAGCYSIALIASQTGAGGTPFHAPQTICSSTTYNGNPIWPFLNQNFAENYDAGGQGLGFIIPANLNSGDCTVATPYRSDQANLKTSTFTPPTIGYQAGCTQIGFSYSFTTNINATGLYTLSLWLADASSGGSWNAYIDGTLVGNVVTPNTGSYTTFQSSTSGSFNAASGNHILTLACAGGDAFNGCGDLVMWQGNHANAPVISSIALSNGGSFSVPAGAGSNIGTISATCSSGSCAGATFQLAAASGSGGGCSSSAGNTAFAVSGSNLNIDGSTISDTNSRTICLEASMAGAANYFQSFTETGTSGFVCDVGPNALSIPAPAQAAGFTHCFLNADFTSPSFSNINSWLAECGAGVQAQNTWFRIIGADQLHSTLTPGVCGTNAAIVTDNKPGGASGGQALDLTLHRSDYVNKGWTYLAFDWPSSEWGPVELNPSLPGMPAGGPNSHGLYRSAYYTEITFRMTPASSQNVTDPSGTGTSQYQLVDFWQDGCNGCGTPGGNGPEIDFFEVQVHTPGLNAPGPWFFGLGSALGGGNGSSADITQYHTYGYLLTNNGSTQSICIYLDGVKQRNPCGTYSQGSDTFGGILAVWVAGELCFGSGGPNPFDNAGCEGNDAEALVNSIRLFACANFWNQQCQTTLVTDTGDRPTLFAGIMGRLHTVVRWVGDMILPSAQAFDPFDPPSRAGWRCPGGGLGYPNLCMPPEFQGAEWWKACVTGRSDCLPSDTALLGWDSQYRPLRGTGFCYTEQPYTCAPDGKVPQ